MDNTCRFKVELADKVQHMAVNTFRKATSDSERKEVARILRVWHELKVFDASVLDGIRTAIRATGATVSRQFDEAEAAADDDDLEASPAAMPEAPKVSVPGPAPPKRARLDANAA